jgi:hypothetical protein
MSVDMGATEDAASRRSGAPLGTTRLFRQSLLVRHERGHRVPLRLEDRRFDVAEILPIDLER